jgi:hypothetical protein
MSSPSASPSQSSSSSEHLDLRRTLLATVDAFLEGTPASILHAHDLVHQCSLARRIISLDELIWGGTLAELTDSLYYQNTDYLAQTRQLLLEGSPQIHRAYVNCDYRADFTLVERGWYARLEDLLEHLAAIPLTDFRLGLMQATNGKCERLLAGIHEAEALSPPPLYPGEEMLHTRVLREATALLDVRVLVLPRDVPEVGARLVPAPEYTAYDGDVRRPSAGGYTDATCGIDAARRMLRAVAGQGYLVVTYCCVPDQYVLSLH